MHDAGEPAPPPEEGLQDPLERRVDAAIAVLAGRPAADVAADLGVADALVVRWTELFLDGGSDRIAGRAARAEGEDRDRFLAMAAHEFLTPITIIRGWTMTLREPGLAPGVTDQALTAVDAATRKLERISRDVIDSTAVAMGRFRLVTTSVDARAVVAASIAALGSDRLRLGPGEAAWLEADGGRVGQIVDNLLANALLHGGDEAVDVDVSSVGREVVLLVENGGRTPTYDEAKRLFEPFGHGDDSRGPGLGLYVVRALAVAHGGTCGMDVTEGARTRFWVRLPVGGPPASLLVDRPPAGR